MRCLNPNRNTFDFAANIGANSTFDFFKNSRYSNLPEFKVFANNNTIVYSQAALENIIEKFLPKNVFAVQHLNRIVQQLPVESKAAFFKDVLYFGENVSKEDVAEETFHAIFQRLIPSNIRDRYLEEGKGLVENVDQKILELKASQPIIYGNLTKEQAKERVIEEAIAAAYVDYFVKNTTPTDKKNGVLTLLFNLFKWLRNLFYSAKQNESDLELFFGDILKGNFTKSTIQNTNESDVPTLRLVEYTGVDDNGFAVRKTLNNKESDGMIASIASIVIELDDKLSLEQKDNLDLKTRSKRIFFAINKLKDFYLKNGDNFKASALEQYSETKRNPETLKKETIVSPSLQHLKEDVNKYLNVVTGKVQQEEKEVDEDDEAELLGSDTIAANEKGFDGLSAWIRNYISTTGKEIGSFEIDGVENMIKIFEVIDKGKIYYSLARAMQNSTTEIERLYKLVEIASLGTNSDTRILVTRVIRDVRSTNPTDSDRKVFDDFQKDVRDLYRTWKSDKVTHRAIINQIPNLNKDKQFILQTLLQGFNLWNRENYQVNVDIEKLEGKDVVTTKAYPANQNSATEVQIQMWENYFDDVRDRISIRRFNELKTNIESKKDLENSLTEVFSMLFGGMDASYINYLINPSNDNSIGGTYSTTATLADVAEILKVVGEDLKAKESILFKNEDGAVARLKKLAVNTAKVNERVIESTYKDAENKTRYSYQNKTFQLFMFNEFFNSNHIEEYKNKITSNTLYEYSDGKFLTQASRFLYDSTNVETKKGLNHVLFSSEKWKEALSNGLYYSIDGLTTKIGAATFGGMENRDFFLYKLHLQFQRTNNGMQPIHINLMESKRTASFKELMIVEGLYDNNGLTEKATKAFSLEILKELKRMHDEKPKVISWLQQIVSKSVPEDRVVELTRKSVMEASSVSAAEGIIEKYHTGKYKVVLDENNHVVDFIVDSKQARAFNFTDNLKGFLSAKQFEELKEKFFNTTQTFDQVFENLSTNANFLASVKKGLNEYIQEYESEIQKSKGTLPVNTRFGNLNDTKNRTKEQEAQFRNDMLSQWLNTMWVNQLLNSDSALTVKNDGADFVKRAGGQNAAIQSLVTTFVPPASYNITEADDLSKTRYVVGTDPMGIVSFKTKKKSGKTNDVESADAQSYSSVHAYRKYLYGIGKLSNDISQLLNKVELGVPLSNEDIQLMRDRGTYLNVLKPVGYDGFFYFKTGTLMLTRDLTSHWNNQNVSREILFKEGRFTELNDENNWVAKRGRESLHNLRIAMETNNVDYYLAQTASKQLTINKLTKEFDKFPDTLQSDEEFQSSINVMDTNFFGQQMENPAGKKSIIDPSQMLEIILNEQRENVFVRIDGVEVKMKKALSDWVKLSKNRDNLKFTEALNEISNPDFSINYNRFIDKAKESLIASGGDDQLIEFFSKDANGNPEYNLNMSVTIDKFVSLLMSHFTKGVLQQKVAGDSLALISPHGLKGIKKLIKYKAKTEDGYKDVYSWEWIDENSQEYQDAYTSAVPIEDAEYSEVDGNNQITGSLSPLNQTIKNLYEAGNLYVVDELRFGVPVWKTTGEQIDGIPVVHATPEYYGSEALHPSYEKGITNTKDLKGAFAVRIPSQDKHSATNILWVGKLAEFYGNTIAVPKEIQYLSGSDYDIDKLYLHRKEIYYSKENSDWKVWSMKDHTFDKYVMYHSKYNKTVLRYSKEALQKDPYYAKFLAGIDAVKLEMKEVRERLNKEYEEEKLDRRALDVGKLEKELAAIDKEIERLEMSPEDLTEASISESIKNLQLQTDFIKADIEWKKELSEKLQEGYYVLPVQSLQNKLTALNEGLNRVIEFNLYPIFRDLKLITTDTEFNQRAEQGEVMIHPIINNQLLDLKQRFLTNEETLDRSRGEAIALTPATQDNLKELLSQSFVMVNGKQEFLFKDVVGQNPDGTVKYKERFNTDSKWSTHSQLGQNQAHRNVVTGKRNIGVAVVGNLLHLFAKKANLQLLSPISFYDVSKDNELFVNELSTFQKAINEKGNRIADIISELISAATDEAKDQQNAKYNLSIEALNIVIPMLMLGSSLESAILLVNHPKVQEYLQLVSKKGLILKTDVERKALESNNEAILKEMLSSQTLTSTLSILDFKNGRNPDGALALAGKMLQISKEIGSANYIISLKKGLGKDLNSFEAGEEKIDSTTKEKIPKEALTNVATVFTEENPMLEQYQNQISIHDKIARLFDKNIIRRIPSYRELSSIYKANFKNSGYAPFVKWMNDNVLGFVYSKLYFDSLGENKSLYEKQTNEDLKNTETKWGNFLAELKNKDSDISKEIRESLLENPFVKKVRKSKKSTELRIPTFVKSDITSSSSLTDGFLDMHIKLFNTPYESLTRELFHYFVHKDAWIFKAGSLSKGIHPLFFKEHSRSLDGAVQNVQALSDIPTGLLAYLAIEKSMSVYGAEDNVKRISKKISPLTAKIVTDNGFTSKKFGELTKEQKEGLIENGYMMLKDGKYPVLTPPLYHKFNLENSDGFSIGEALHKIYSVDVVINGKQETLNAKDYFANIDTIYNVVSAKYVQTNVQLGSTLSLPLTQKDLEYTNYTDLVEENQSSEKSVLISDEDRIVFGHPLIGKSFLKNDGDSRFLSLDDDYASEIEEGRNQIIEKYKKQYGAENSGEELTKYQIQNSGGTKEWNLEYKKMMQRIYEKAKVEAIKTNKTLFLSNTELLKNNLADFDKVINIPDEVFINRVKKSRPNAKYDIAEWKNQINEVLKKVPSNKIINTTGYLSDLIPKTEESVLNTYNSEELDAVFEQASELKSIGTKEQYSKYLNTIFPNSKVKDIVYRGSEVSIEKDSKLYLYFTNNKTEAYMYSKAHISKGGNISERTPIPSIKTNFKKYIDNKYGTNVYDSLALDEIDYLEQVGEDEYKFAPPEWYVKDVKIKISKRDEESFSKLERLIELYNYVKIESENDLIKQFDDNLYIENIDEYNSLRKEFEDYFETKDIGNISAVLLNIENPYMEEIVQEDLENDRDAYKNGHDGAFLMDGDHFVVKNKPEQIHILGSKSDIQSFKEFVKKSVLNSGENSLTSQNQLLTKMNEITNYSGAALGSDKYWESLGKEFGIRKTVNYEKETLSVLTQEQLKEVENAYQKAVRDLGRGILSADSDGGKLVRRDYLQAKAADAVFAVSAIVEPNQKDKKGYTNKTSKQIVEGGTGYAVQMGINLGKTVYVFDQNKNSWYTWNGNSFIQTQTPILTTKFAGIGTRELKENGKQAIRDVYTTTLNSISTPPTNFEQETVQGINIFSKSTDWLGKALTNPTYSKYQIPDSKGNLFDVESLYKAFQSKKTQPQLPFDEALRYDMNLMMNLQVQKFLKYPELVKEIDKRGGKAFIENSSHIVGVKNSRWEGKGLESNFIKVLSKSYEIARRTISIEPFEQETGESSTECIIPS